MGTEPGYWVSQNSEIKIERSESHQNSQFLYKRGGRFIAKKRKIDFPILILKINVICWVQFLQIIFLIRSIIITLNFISKLCNTLYKYTLVIKEALQQDIECNFMPNLNTYYIYK